MKVKNTYLLIVTVIGLFSLALYSTYAMFTASVDVGEFVNLTAATLPADTSMLEYERITLNSGDSKLVDLNITNSTTNSLYYGVWYEMIDPSSKTSDITIAKLDTSTSETIGELSSSTNSKVTLILENYTADVVIINIGVGYSATSSLNLPTNRNIVSDVASEGIDASTLPDPTPVNFDYTGVVQTYTIPSTGLYKLEVWGAQGGYRSSSTYGGKGGYSYGTVTLNKGDTLYVYAGGAGGNGTSGCGSTICSGGFNGGGYRYKYYGGGGASDIRINQDNYNSRVIVAGGGGSDGATGKKGMYGGGETGGSSTENYTAISNYGGKGGTQTYSGYSTSYTVTTQATTGLNSNTLANYGGGFGFGGGGVYLSSGYGGAGGGGWYGGSGNVPDSSGDDDRGGGGGSGFVYTESTSSNVPSGYTLNSSYYLTDAATVAGNTSFTSPTGTSETGHSSNGYARITGIRTAPSLDGLTDLALEKGTSHDLLSDVTCVDNGDGCTILKVSITDTSTLAVGEYIINYTVKDNNNQKYKFTRRLLISESMATKIISLKQGTTWESGASGLYEVSYTKEDGTTIGKDYRYIGANVHNYVKFNNDMYQIIGVFDENTHGKQGEYLVKLISADLMTANSWGVINSSATSGTYSNYYNDWTGKQYATPANTNILFNQYFLNKTNTSGTYESCNNWTYFYNSNDYKTQDCNTLVGYGIDSSLQNYIETVTWHLNGYDSNGLTSNNFYLCERGIYTNCTSANSGAGDTSTTAKIGLMYVSDYMYASGYKDSSSTLTGSSYYNGSQNWMFKGYEWTIIPYYSYADVAFSVDSNGMVFNNNSRNGYGARPTFYLKSNVKITEGEGTFDNPYTISM